MSDPRDLEYYDEPVVPPAWEDVLFAGVTKGYIAFRCEDGTVQELFEGTLLSAGDGRFYWQENEGES